PNTPREFSAAHARYISTIPGTNLNSFHPVVRSSTISTHDSPSRTPSMSRPSVIIGDLLVSGKGPPPGNEKIGSTDERHLGARRDRDASDGDRFCEVPGGRRAGYRIMRGTRPTGRGTSRRRCALRRRAPS